MLPRKIFDKNGVFWYNLGRPKVCYYQPKNQQENLIAIFLSQINVDEHVSMKINTFRIYKGGLGGEEFSKKSNKMEAFPYFFFLLFGKAPYIPKIMSLLPSSPKIITSAPQLPENK